MPLKREQENLKRRVEYNYYIDEYGLYYKSTLAGELYEEFDINGVCKISESIGVDILYLCYIANEEETDT